MDNLNWWKRPRVINIVVDNDSWILTWSELLATQLSGEGDEIHIVRNYEDVKHGSVAFYLGCLRVTPPDILARNQRSLVVHASDLPQGRGFSPWTWQVLEGCSEIPVCLIDAVEEVDAGPVVYKEYIHLEGHELIGEIRDAIGTKTVELCARFIGEKAPPTGVPQKGKASWYGRRIPADSEIDPKLPLKSIFNQLRVADNYSYPVLFKMNGVTYQLKIDKVEE